MTGENMRRTLIDKRKLIVIPMTLVLAALIFISVTGYMLTRSSLLNQMKNQGRELSLQIVSQIKGNAASERLIREQVDEQIEGILNAMVLYDFKSYLRADGKTDLRGLVESLKIDEVSLYDSTGNVIFTSNEDHAVRITIGHALHPFLNSKQVTSFFSSDDVITGNNLRYGVRRLENGDILQVGVSIERLVELTRQFRYQTLMMRLVENEHVISATILNEEQMVIASSELAMIGSEMPKDWSVGGVAYSHGELRVITPMDLGEGEIAALVLSLSNAESRKLLWQSTIIFVIVSFIAIASFLVLQTLNVTRPVQRLDQSIGMIDLEENMDYRVTLESGNPFIGLGDNINGILDKAQSYFHALKQEAVLLAQSEERFLESAKQSKTMTWEVDASGLYKYVSPVSFELIGYHPEEIVAKVHFYDLMPESHRDEAHKVTMAFFEKRLPLVDHDGPMLHKSGRTVWVTTGGVPMIDDEGRLLGYRGNDTDITEWKKVNQQLQLTIDRLKESETKYRHLLEDKQEELKLAVDELISKEKMASLGGLVAGVAHEINTPLGVAITATSYMHGMVDSAHKQMIAGKMTKSYLAEFFETFNGSISLTEENLSRAAELVKSFKSIASNQHYEELKEFDLYELVEDIALSYEYELSALGHQVRVDCQAPLMVKTYPGVLTQVLTNLFGNALTHGFENRTGGNIGIAIEKLGERLTIEFKDDGAGMDVETKNKVFEPFFTKNKGHGGTGLGMSIVHNLIVDRLGGRIQIESAPGQGTTYLIEFKIVE